MIKNTKFDSQMTHTGGLTFLHVMLGNGSPSASQGMTSSLPASCLYSPPGTTENLGGSCPGWDSQNRWVKKKNSLPPGCTFKCTVTVKVPLAPGEREGTIPWNPGHCKACRYRCRESPPSPLPHGCSHLPFGSNQGTVDGWESWIACVRKSNVVLEIL